MFNESLLVTVLKKLPETTDFIIAYSGGLDSTVLLHACAKIREYFPKQNFSAIHINHGLSPNADSWQAQCLAFSETHKIQLACFKANAIPGKGESPEDAARKARYQILKKQIKRNVVLLTAHHQDDQAETVLLQLFRGAGVQGLSAMPFCTRFSEGYLARPLLQFSRAELKEYAELEKLIWVEDESNSNTHFSRNFMRHDVLPIIKRKYPSINSILARTAENAAYTHEINNELAALDLKNILLSKDSLAISKLLALSDARRNNVLRYFLQQRGYFMPHAIHLKQLQQTILQAKPDANPVLKWRDVEVRRYQDQLYIAKENYFVGLHEAINVNLYPEVKTEINLPNELGTIIFSITAQTDTVMHCTVTTNLSFITTQQEIVLLHAAKIIIQFRAGGEKIRPQNRKETHELKKLFQEWSVPTWQRQQIPLLYANEELAAVLGYCISDTCRYM